MTESRSYKLEPEAGAWEQELLRLKTQVDLSWQEEMRLLTQLGLHDGMAIVELGSGPGFLTERLLSMLPTSRVTAVEVDAAIHADAKRRFADTAPERLQLHCASAEATGLASDQFDFAMARYLFQHLDAPVAVTTEARRILRPGGQLVVIDIDAALWGVVTPYHPALQQVFQKAGRWQTSQGGNRLVGRQLWRFLKEAGFEDLHLDAFVYHSDALGITAFQPQLSPIRLLPALKAGLISPSEFALVNTAYQQFLDNPEAYILMVGLMAHGRKPLAAVPPCGLRPEASVCHRQAY
jgi:ubiquinone/menaquinone biosynthesis C-methylase UbiE